MPEHDLDNPGYAMKATRYQELMEELLNDKLYMHSRGVAEAAAFLAKSYGEDKEKAYFAGIVHDYGKRYKQEELIEKADQMELHLDPVTRRESRLLHAPVGAALLQSELQVKDPDVLRAVYYHTTGRKNMTGLEKIIYLADYIEEGRDFEGSEKIRKIARENPDRALLAAVEFAIRSVLERGLLLHPRSVAFRNSLVLARRESE